MTSKRLVYEGKDLEAMSFAVNYHRWILDEFRPFLGKKVVEVGAGTGSFSELLLEEKPESLALVEPSEMFQTLETRFRDYTEADVRAYNSIFSQVAGKIREQNQPDSIIYVNVLEHIEDDGAELKTVRETLDKNGRVFVFVPALEWLYGEFDRRIGHYRRYVKPDLEEKVRSAGFKILKSRYFDLIGIAPWWIKYGLLKSDSLESGAVALYDRFAVPVTKTIEKIARPPLGKNLLVVAQKVD